MVPARRQRLQAATRLSRYGYCALFLLAAFAGWQPQWLLSAPESKLERTAIQLDITGVIGPASLDYVERGFAHAAESGAELIILRMDTPGGLDTSMRDIIQRIIAAPMPVVTYVAPSGARAASAGTYILYASHVAAMAPGTNLGAATPVQLGGMPGAPGEEPEQPDQNKESKDTPAPKSAMERKMVNDAVAYIRGLAELRGRNVEWAEKAVVEAASLPATQAREMNVIDVVARDIPDLLQKIDGRLVQVNNSERELDTAELAVVQRAPDWRTELLAIITNPNIAYVLMLVGIYGLIFEFSNPGALVPGIAGAICLLLALFAFQVLPVNYAGMALMLLGMALMVGEAFIPSVGVLGIGGVIAFVAGSIILMDTDVPGYGVSPALIGGIALFSGALFAILMTIAVKARKRPVVSGEEQLIGAIAVCNQDFADEGSVHIHGENWRARSTRPLQKNQRVRVRERRGLTLHVDALPEAYSEETS